MADTVAVMNAGRIEQLGAPAELYEFPAPPSSPTSSASPTCSPARSPAAAATTCWSTRTAPGSVRRRPRARRPSGEVWLGVRPEKMHLAARRRGRAPGANVLAGGVVTDASFVGVSTQYLVRTVGPGADGVRAEHRRPRARSGRRRGRPALGARHAFLLDAGPGRPRRRRAPEDGVSAAVAHAVGGTAEARARRSARPERQQPRLAGYLLLLPGALWLVLFFAVPLVTLFATSLYDPAGSLEPGYAMTGHSATTPTRCSEYWPQFLRSFGLRRHRDRSSACCSATRWPTRSRSRPAGGRTCCWSRDRAVLHQLPAAHAGLEATSCRQRAAWSDCCSDAARARRRRPAAGHPVAVVAGLTYNFLPFMVLPLYASPGEARPAADRGGRRPLRHAGHGVPQGHAAAVDARRGRRHAADLHPGGRRLHQRRAARHPADST